MRNHLCSTDQLRLWVLEEAERSHYAEHARSALTARCVVPVN
jgi:hypothetical protein